MMSPLSPSGLSPEVLTTLPLSVQLAASFDNGAVDNKGVDKSSPMKDENGQGGQIAIAQDEEPLSPWEEASLRQITKRTPNDTLYGYARQFLIFISRNNSITN